VPPSLGDSGKYCGRKYKGSLRSRWKPSCNEPEPGRGIYIDTSSKNRTDGVKESYGSGIIKFKLVCCLSLHNSLSTPYNAQ
jgi:hypothetical protein